MYHCHFDCFSGAAGDMLLASCLDVADSLPGTLQFDPPPGQDAAGDGRRPSGEKNSDALLARIVRDIEEGMPELRGEFSLSAKRVWRGMGRIAAKKVDVGSAYDHEAAPVPGAKTEAPPSHEHAHQHRHDHEHDGQVADDHDEEKEETRGGDSPIAHDDSHGHSHGHSHDHGHPESHAHSHNHADGHGDQPVSFGVRNHCLL